jgi:hypothetical protein
MNLEFSIKPRLKKNIITKLLPGVIFGSFLVFTSDAQATPWASGPGPLAYTTTQGNFGGVPTSFDSGFSSFLGDKQVKIISTNGVLPVENTVTFEYDPVYSQPWRVNYQTAGITASSGSLNYRIKLDSAQDGLGVCTTYGKCGPTFILGTASPAHVSDGFLQTFYQASGDGPGSLIGSINGSGSINLSSYDDLYVSVSWTGLQLSSGTTMGYSQVPAPLPILGAAAFFGSVRRIGQASKRLRAIPKG